MGKIRRYMGLAEGTVQMLVEALSKKVACATLELALDPLPGEKTVVERRATRTVTRTVTFPCFPQNGDHFTVHRRGAGDPS